MVVAVDVRAQKRMSSDIECMSDISMLIRSSRC